MNKLNTQLQAPTFVVDHPCPSDLYPARHLLVLVSADSDYTTATRRVWELANALGASVQLLGLCDDPAEESSIRRGLVTMASLLGGSNVAAQLKVQPGTNWGRAVKENYQVGDAIVCFAEQRVGILQKPLSQILPSDLNAPIFILSGLSPQDPPRPSWLFQFMIWAGSLGIIAGSFLLQIRITLLPQDWAQTALMILSVMAEIGLIWGWNSLFS